jgi:thiol-disulfide isomerase/thioredoxin
MNAKNAKAQSRRSFVAGASAVAALLRARVAGASPPRDAGGGGGVGSEVWKSIALVGIDGREITLGQVNAPVVIVHVWASWCAACLGELPSLQGWAARLGPAVVAPLLVSHPKHWEADKAFLRRTGVALPAYTVAADTSWDMRVAAFDIVGGSFALPRTLVFAGRDRRCVLAKEGPENWESPQVATRLKGWLGPAPA